MARGIAVGSVLEGGYEVVKPIAMGGFGTVFRAVHRRTGQDVAVKVLRIGPDTSPASIARLQGRFKREMKLCAALHHPHIVSLLDSGSFEDNLFSIFEYVPGQTLKGFLDAQGALPPQLATSLMLQVLDAIACAHQQGVVHRDIKPENIMITQTGARPLAKVLDFGIGTLVLSVREAEYQSLTLTEEMVGTPAYSAPEQLRGALPTPKSDIYSWALVYLECLTGERVMGGQALAEVFHQQLRPTEIPLPPALAGHPLGGFLRRALTKEPQQRAGDAARLLAELQSIQIGDLVGALGSDTPTSPGHKHPSEQETVLNRGRSGSLVPEMRKQATILSYSLTATDLRREEPDIEVLEAVLAEQHRECADTVIRYGGFLCGSLADRALVCFGHPRVSDTDARRAGRTALELARHIAQRSSVLERQQGIRLELRMGIHTGSVLVKSGGVPDGFSPSIAMRLESAAQPGEVLASDATRARLEQHLEFEPAGKLPIFGGSKPLSVHRLLGEHLVEALRFAPSGAGDRPILGRDAEVARLVADLDACYTTGGRAVLIVGEAGIGKSRLLDELHHITSQRGARMRHLRCLPEHQNNALRPMLDYLGKQLDLASAESPEDAAQRVAGFLADVEADTSVAVPLMCSWFGLPLPEGHAVLPHAPQHQRQLMLDLLERLLVAPSGAQSKQQPVVLAVEDLHWADPTTVELLDRLVGKLAQTPLLLVATTRPDSDHTLGSLMDGQHPGTRKESLGALGEADVKALIAELVPGGVVDAEVVTTILERTDGVPLFVQELTRMLLDGVLVERDGQYTLADRERLSSIPVTLRDSLLERLERRGAAREVAQTAAAIGREFDFDLLATASDRDETRLRSELDDLLSASLIHRRRRMTGESYVFSHALVRDAAYDSMPRWQREQVHARLAQAIENSFPELAHANPAELARHHAAAGAFSRAVECGIEAAQKTLALSQNQETVAGCTRVLEWVQALPVEQRVTAELDVNGLMTPALMACHGWADDRVKAQVTRSRMLLAEQGETPHRFPTLCSLVFYHHVASNRHEARSLADELLQTAKQASDVSGEVLATTLLGQCRWIEGDYLTGNQLFDEANRLYDPSAHQSHAMTLGLDTRAWATASSAQLRYFLGERTAAFRAIDSAQAWAESINSIPTLGLVLFYRALVCQYDGDKIGVASASARAIDLAEQYGLPAIEAYTRMLDFWANDDADSALPVLEQLWAMGCRLGLSYYTYLPADIARQRGDFDVALAQIEKSLGLCEELHEHYYEPELQRRKAECLLATAPANLGAIDSALERSAELARRQGMDRSEASALVMRARHLGPDDRSIARLQVLQQHRPEAFGESERVWLDGHVLK